MGVRFFQACFWLIGWGWDMVVTKVDLKCIFRGFLESLRTIHHDVSVLWLPLHLLKSPCKSTKCEISMLAQQRFRILVVGESIFEFIFAILMLISTSDNTNVYRMMFLPVFNASNAYFKSGSQSGGQNLLEHLPLLTNHLLQ